MITQCNVKRAVREYKRGTRQEKESGKTSQRVQYRWLGKEVSVVGTNVAAFDGG